jgi:hypothetical protein
MSSANKEKGTFGEISDDQWRGEKVRFLWDGWIVGNEFCGYAAGLISYWSCCKRPGSESGRLEIHCATDSA